MAWLLRGRGGGVHRGQTSEAFFVLFSGFYLMLNVNVTIFFQNNEPFFVEN